MVRRTVLALSAAAVLAAPLVTEATGPTRDDGDALPTAGPIQQPQIVGGRAAGTCEWPSTVLLENDSTLCTGVLVHPRVVLYAAHCGVDFDIVVFGERYDAGYYVQVLECRRRSDGERTGPNDFAYCELARPVHSVPVAPILYGCEEAALTEDREVTIVGFGEDENRISGLKRYAAADYGGEDGSMLLVGGEAASASFGDSGGPAFVQLDDGSWRTFGIVSGGPGPGSPIYYVDTRTVAGWVEERAGHDLTPCHAEDGSWDPSYRCGGFATAPTGGGTWDSQCSQGDPLSGRSETCGEPQAADEDLPVVVIASPEYGEVFEEDPTDLVIEVDATDETSGIERVFLTVDGELFAEDEEEPWSFTTTLDRGLYGVEVAAEDRGGNTARSEQIVVQIGDDASGCFGCGAGGRDGPAGLLVGLLAGLAVRVRSTCRRGSRPRR